MKINNCRGDLTDISAKKEALILEPPEGTQYESQHQQSRRSTQTHLTEILRLVYLQARINESLSTLDA